MPKIPNFDEAHEILLPLQKLYPASFTNLDKLLVAKSEGLITHDEFIMCRAVVLAWRNEKPKPD